jgi:predicted secreted protein
MRVDERSHASELRLRLQDLLEVVLPETPTTGFTWHLVAAGEPTCRLEQDDFVPPSAATLGAPGRHRWTFRAVAPGEGAIELHHARAFEATEPERRFRLRVVVE